MGRRATDHGDNAEWLPAAQFYDHHLGSSQPVVLHGGEIEAQPLQVHIHKGMDVGTVLSGAMDLIQGDFHQRFTTGDVWLTAMWEPHAWEVPRPNLCNVTFTFLPGVLENAVEKDLRLLDMFVAAPRERPQVRDDRLRSEVLEIGRSALREYEVNPWSDGYVNSVMPGHTTMVVAHLLRLLVTLRRSWTPPAYLPRRSPHFADSVSRIMPALTLIHTNTHRRVRVSEAAEACSMSRAWFHRLFRETMGITFGKFCLRARLGVAARELLDTDVSVEAIALQSGFADASHLHHNFTRHYGLTPAAFRARARAISGAEGSDG